MYFIRYIFKFNVYLWIAHHTDLRSYTSIKKFEQLPACRLSDQRQVNSPRRQMGRGHVYIRSAPPPFLASWSKLPDKNTLAYYKIKNGMPFLYIYKTEITQNKCNHGIRTDCSCMQSTVPTYLFSKQDRDNREYISVFSICFYHIYIK